MGAAGPAPPFNPSAEVGRRGRARRVHTARGGGVCRGARPERCGCFAGCVGAIAALRQRGGEPRVPPRSPAGLGVHPPPPRLRAPSLRPHVQPPAARGGFHPGPARLPERGASQSGPGGSDQGLRSTGECPAPGGSEGERRQRHGKDVTVPAARGHPDPTRCDQSLWLQ